MKGKDKPLVLLTPANYAVSKSPSHVSFLFIYFSNFEQETKLNFRAKKQPTNATKIFLILQNNVYVCHWKLWNNYGIITKFV